MRTVGSIAAALFYACAPALTTTAESPEAPPITTMQSALATIFANRLSVVSFGEIHKRDSLSYPSTAWHFANEILPLLPEYGFRDLVVEFLPDDPVIDREIAAFMERGALGNDTPHLYDWLDGPDLCNYLQMLQVARANGIRVHGGHLNLAEAPDPYRIAEMYEQNPEYYAGLIQAHTLGRIQRVLNGDRRVASYGGMRHNNYSPTPQDAAASFGDELYLQLGKRYAEVDLLVPELGPSYPDQINIPSWENLIPASGVTLFGQGRRSLLIFPRTPRIIKLDPLQLLDCLL